MFSKLNESGIPNGGSCVRRQAGLQETVTMTSAAAAADRTSWYE